ncbi:MAG TPA: hypothetical protein IGQ44_12540 [Geminocystis sp. M7585_C2015_104]|nr:hypothetical protein [Geminocystis sp. M7585_C2015_104]
MRGSGDVVNEVINLSKKLADGTISPQSPPFPSIVSVDGEIFPGKNYIPPYCRFSPNSLQPYGLHDYQRIGALLGKTA